MKFLRQDTNKEKGIKQKWRTPRGKHSKLRLNKAGHRKKPSQGFRAPKKERYLHPSGFKIHLIHNLQELSRAQKAVVISSKLGLKKKLELLTKAKELNLQVLNMKNVEDFIKKTTESLKNKKEKKKKRETKKKKEKEKALKKAEVKKEEKEEEKKQIDKTKGLPQPKDKPQDLPQKQAIQIARPTAPKQK